MSQKNNKNRQIKVMKLSDQDDNSDLKNTTPTERWAMMWQLTLDAWAFKGEPLAEQRLQRNIVRIFKRES